MSHTSTQTSSRRIYAIIISALCAVSFICGAITLGILLSRGGHYFHGGAYVALAVTLALTSAASAVTAFVLRRSIPATQASFGGHLGSISMHTLCIAGILLFGIYHIVRGVMLIPSALPAGICLLLSGALAVLGFRFSMHSMRRDELAVVISGTGLSMSCLFYALYLYFDASTPKNAGMKHLLILTFLLLALFFLSEIRRVLEKKQSLFYMITNALALQLTAALSVAPVAMTIAGHAPLTGDVFTYLFVIVSFLYIIIWSVLPHFLFFGEATPPAEAVSDMNDLPATDTTGDDAL